MDRADFIYDLCDKEELRYYDLTENLFEGRPREGCEEEWEECKEKLKLLQQMVAEI